MNLKPRTLVITPALRELLKDPKKAKEFADGANAFAAGLRAVSEIREKQEREREEEP